MATKMAKWIILICHVVVRVTFEKKELLGLLFSASILFPDLTY